MKFIEEKIREDIKEESNQLRILWFEKIILLLNKCKGEKRSLREAVLNKETLKDFNDLKPLLREYRRRLRNMISGMKEANEFKKEVYPKSKEKIFSDIEIGLYCFILEHYRKLTNGWMRQYQASVISI